MEKLFGMPRAALDVLLDRPLLAINGAAFALCSLTAVVVWYRIIRPRQAMATVPPVPVAEMESLSLCAGIVFAAVAARYGLIALARLGILNSRGFEYDVVSIGLDISIIAAALMAVYYATKRNCGKRALTIWAGLSILAAGLFWALGS